MERHRAQGFLWEAWQGDKVVGAFARYREEDGRYEVHMYRIRK